MRGKKVDLNTVSITDFNRGKANSIFKEAKKRGPIYVFKNNKPVSVVLSVKEFQNMKNKIEDLEDFILAADHLYNSSPNDKTYSLEELDKKLGISKEELEKTPLPDFE